MTNLEVLTTMKNDWNRVKETGRNSDGSKASKNAIAGADAVLQQINERIKLIMEAGQ